MEPIVYSFLNQKGSVGKTTLAIHIADAFARQGQRVLLVDADAFPDHPTLTPLRDSG